LYNAQTYAHLVPMWEVERGFRSSVPKTLYQRFQEANQWINDYLVFYPISQKGYLNRIRSSHFLGFMRKFREFILDSWWGDSLEFILKKVQERRIKKDPLTYKSGGRVVFNGSQLEFHPDSPEKIILEKYNQKMKELGLDELGQEKDSGLIR
jgi:hypothetical protein